MVTSGDVMSMDLRQLRTFDAVVAHGSFTGAAAALGYTQSAVSQQIAGLEASLGVTLFHRRPFAVTPAAERLAEHAASILVRIDVARSELRAVERRATTRIVATSWSAASPAVARLLALARRHDGAGGASLATADVDSVTAEVARGECAAGVVDGIVGAADPLAHADPGLVTSLLVGTSPIAVAMPSDHPFARRRSLRWPAVADAQWIDAPLMVARAGPGAASLIERRWGRIAYEGGDTAALGALVAAGHGLAIVPAWWHTAPGTCAVVLDDPPLVHRIEVLVLRQHAAVWEPLVAAAVSG
jgi:DNA-binding transcriptional LysR family regulator